MVGLVSGYGDDRRGTVRWLYAAIISWAISFVLMGVFGAYVIIRGNQVNDALCRVSDDNRTTLVKILEKVRDNALLTATGVPERNLIRQNFAELIALVPPLKCNESGGPKELEP